MLRGLDEGVDYAPTPEVGREEHEAELSVPLPATAVEPVDAALPSAEPAAFRPAPAPAPAR